ncbi:MAG: hypothetical protein LBT86_10615 [Deltaproteobacteria bacterium]|jgi:hypothetical protein|nr:hypothetical protein [Deltaproteobacteria bacterium]
MSETAPVFSKQILELIHYSGLFTRVCVVLALVAVVVASILGGLSGAVGTSLGCGLVLANVLLLRQTIIHSRPGRLSHSIFWTVLKFNLAFLVTGVSCWLIIKFRLGSPLAFLGGLSIFFVGMFVTVIWGGALYLLKFNQDQPLAPLAASAEANALTDSPDARDSSVVAQPRPRNAPPETPQASPPAHDPA